MNALRLNVFFLLFISLLTTKTYAQMNSCISHEDLVEVSESFTQVLPLIGNKTEYCQDDLGVAAYNIVRALTILKNIQPNEPSTNQNDAFTLKAISENNWWAYFTKRAKFFTIEKKCNEHVVAYVKPFWEEASIHLCPPFFQQTLSSQASVLMHEVRHFDGHGHVTCKRGNENGIKGACDDDINLKGSYAISVQTLVGLARSNQTDPREKPLLEAEAMYITFNKFNALPKVEIRNSVFLSNKKGEVYKWTVGKDAPMMGQLEEPAFIINSFGSLTVFPTNAESDAYRINKTLTETASRPGLFAQVYNHSKDREDYESISYFGTGGLLKNNELTTFCDNKTLATQNLDSLGKITRIVSISSDPFDLERHALLLSDDGSLTIYGCAAPGTSEVSFQKINLTVSGKAKDLVESFSLGGIQYALLKDGELVTLALNDNVFSSEDLSLPIANQGWIGATPISRPEVF